MIVSNIRKDHVRQHREIEARKLAEAKRVRAYLIDIREKYKAMVAARDAYVEAIIHAKENGRVTYGEIAEVMGRSEDTIRETVRKHRERQLQSDDSDGS